MKGNDLLRAMNEIDESFIQSAGRSQAAKPRSRKKRIRMTAAIAAALICAIPAAAYAAGAFLHGDNVEHYITGAELLEAQSPEAILNAVTENANYRITADAALSDGHNVMMILTHEAKTPKGLIIKSDLGFVETYLKYADGTPGPFRKTPESDETPRTSPDGGYAFDESAGLGFDRTVTILNCRNVDPEKEVTIEFFKDLDHTRAAFYYWKRDYPDLLRQTIPDFDFDRNITNELDGLSITMKFAPNVKCVPLYREDGAELYLSAFELYTEQSDVLSTTVTSEYDEVLGDTCEQLVPLIKPENLCFIRNDGERVPFVPDPEFDKSDICMGEDFNSFIFGMFIDPDEYQGVEIDGVSYLKAE